MLPVRASALFSFLTVEHVIHSVCVSWCISHKCTVSLMDSSLSMCSETAGHNCKCIPSSAEEVPEVSQDSVFLLP